MSLPGLPDPLAALWRSGALRLPTDAELREWIVEWTTDTSKPSHREGPMTLREMRTFRPPERVPLLVFHRVEPTTAPPAVAGSPTPSCRERHCLLTHLLHCPIDRSCHD